MKNTIKTMAMAAAVMAGVIGAASAAGLEDMAAQGNIILATTGKTTTEAIQTFKVDSRAALLNRLFALQDRKRELQEGILNMQSALSSQIASFRETLQVGSRGSTYSFSEVAAHILPEVSKDSDEEIMKKCAEATIYKKACPERAWDNRPSRVCSDGSSYHDNDQAYGEELWGGLPYDACVSGTYPKGFRLSGQRYYTCAYVADFTSIRDHAKALFAQQRELADVISQIAQIKKMLGK